MASHSLIHVAVGVLRDARGCVLIARRPEGTHLAGKWEFPGGKLEPDETVADALQRELDEELGIGVRGGIQPLIRVRHEHADRTVLLDVQEIGSYRGEPTPREGQELAWVLPDELPHWPLIEADRPIVNALRLPDAYLITPPDPPSVDALLTGIEKAVATGVRLFQLRLPAWPTARVRGIAPDVLAICRASGARLLIHDDVALAVSVGADGVHLSARRVLALAERPAADQLWVAASCHDGAELARARTLGLDFAALGPVQDTESHPRRAAMGWDLFARLADRAGLPVYALGGMRPADVSRARACGGRGIAGIRGLWP